MRFEVASCELISWAVQLDSLASVSFNPDLISNPCTVFSKPVTKTYSLFLSVILCDHGVGLARDGLSLPWSRPPPCTTSLWLGNLFFFDPGFLRRGLRSLMITKQSGKQNSAMLSCYTSLKYLFRQFSISHMSSSMALNSVEFWPLIFCMKIYWTHLSFWGFASHDDCWLQSGVFVLVI